MPDTYLKALSKMEKLKDENYICTTDHCTEVEEDENIIPRKYQKKDNYIAPVYDLSGKLSKQNNSSSNGNFVFL